jgi:hypothetical protein
VREVIERLERLGGVASYRQLRAAASRSAISSALAGEAITRPARGRYCLPTAIEGRRAAHELKGVACLRTAAAAWGWKLKQAPRRPEVAVPRGRKVSTAVQARVDVRWRTLAAADVEGWVTSPVRTVIDCATALPFDEALAVADSALRSGRVTSHELLVAAGRLRTRGRQAALRVAEHADGRAHNPFESVIRAVAIGVPGLCLEPQVGLWLGDRRVRPDLLDRRLRVIAEADSFEFHTTRRQIDHDCWRYSELGLDNWLVLRFSWEHAMHQQDWMHSVFVRAVVRQERSLRTTTTPLGRSD